MNKLLSACSLYILALSNSWAEVDTPKHEPLTDKPNFVAEKGYRAVTMAELASFKLNSQKPENLPKPEDTHFIDNQIPAKILKLTDTPIQIEGYIYPLELEGDKAVVFLLLPGQMGCCFSKMPELNEYLYVEMEGGIEIQSDVPTMVFGTLTMGDKVYNNYDQSIVYLLKATKIKTL